MFYTRSKKELVDLSNDERMLASLLIPNVYYTIPEIQMCIRYFQTNIANIAETVQSLEQKGILVLNNLPDEYCEFRKQIITGSDMLLPEERDAVNRNLRGALENGIFPPQNH